MDNKRLADKFDIAIQLALPYEKSELLKIKNQICIKTQPIYKDKVELLYKETECLLDGLLDELIRRGTQRD